MSFFCLEGDLYYQRFTSQGQFVIKWEKEKALECGKTHGYLGSMVIFHKGGEM